MVGTHWWTSLNRHAQHLGSPTDAIDPLDHGGLPGMVHKTTLDGKTTELPLSFLVGFQGFRIVVEALIHLAVQEGVAHPTMTWFGTNWDITAGVSALMLAPFANRISSFILQIWNVSMALILVITVVTGVMAAPTPFRQIMGEPANTWVAHFPFVWLPTILVFCAWLGHIVLYRKLSSLVSR